MIISASYRTDIPAFYGKWFMNRLNAGYCGVENPYGGQAYRVDLTQEAVDGFVFWTKNLTPFVDKLAEIKERNYPFVIQYSINGYPRDLEFSVIDANRSIEHMHFLAKTFGKRVAVWRYDPVTFTSLTPPNFHRENFERLAKSISGATDEVVISFAQIYQKTFRNMNWAADAFGFEWNDPEDEVKLALATEFQKIAVKQGMKLTVCSQNQYIPAGGEATRCIDANRLSDIANKAISAKVKGNRPDCACHISRDIGAYDTCPHGCVYCYAVQQRTLAQDRYRNHNPENEFLFGDQSLPEIEDLNPAKTSLQPKLL